MGQGFGKDKIEQRPAKPEQKKDLLVRLGEVIEWEVFRASLERVHKKPRKSKAGRKTHDVILMFKISILNIRITSVSYPVPWYVESVADRSPLGSIKPFRSLGRHIRSKH
jgi:hypothetical protein